VRLVVSFVDYRFHVAMILSLMCASS